MTTTDELLAILVLRGVDGGVRVTVAGEESHQPDEVGRARRPDEQRSAGAELDEAGPTEDERPHDPLTDLRLGHQHRADALPRNAQCLHRVDGVAVEHRRTTRELSQLPQEHARERVIDGDLLPQVSATADLHPALDEHEESMGNRADFEERLAGLVVMDLAEAAQAIDLLRLEDGKGLARLYLPLRCDRRPSLAAA